MTKTTRSAPRPDAIRIFGRTFSISYVPPSPLSNASVGLCDGYSQAIHIEDGQPPFEETDSVLHEVLHAIRYAMKLDLAPETEERVVAAFASGLAGVLQDNPEFAQWLIEARA